MPALYDTLRQTAFRLLTDNGVAGTLAREVPGVYDPLTDTDTTSTDTYAVRVLLVPLRTGSAEQDWQAFVGAYTVERMTRAYVTLSASVSPIYPSPGDRLTADGVVWTVLGNSPVQPDGKAILHNVVMAR